VRAAVLSAASFGGAVLLAPALLRFGCLLCLCNPSLKTTHPKNPFQNQPQKNNLYKTNPQNNPPPQGPLRLDPLQRPDHHRRRRRHPRHRRGVARRRLLRDAHQVWAGVHLRVPGGLLLFMWLWLLFSCFTGVVLFSGGCFFPAALRG